MPDTNQSVGMTLPHTLPNTFPRTIDEAPNERLFTRLAVENVAPLWPQIHDLLKLDEGIGITHSIEDIHKMILSHRIDAWIQFFKPFSVLEAVVITEFVGYPRGLFLRAWIACALPTAKLDVDSFYHLISAWAFNNDCVGMIATGRRGWFRKFSNVKNDSYTSRIMFPRELNK